ncbi:TAXI family TRAP transporter solute-binding subunit [Umezawaea tangerina]|uniref:TAXI family TRAP transporter solute-binding subunit n=1 Tax=Umezawaea tangerina TaxID=84725 RepID=UPI0024820AB0|nr:TAXI family TRAP transporter solute-binding subunit [Umezawaea tangerina]
MRRVHAAGAVLALAAMALSACGNDLSALKLTMASGVEKGVYNRLSMALADAWTEQLGIEHPQVVSTNGSVDNLGRLRTGQANVGFSQADAAEEAAGTPGQHKLYALARMHDDYLQVVVRADLKVNRLADLKGLRVSIGSSTSGVRLIADRLLKSAGISPDADLRVQHLDLNDASAAMLAGNLDAFIWSGGLPTAQVTQLAQSVKVTMLDLSDVLTKLRADFPVYGSAELPASAYNLPGQDEPITTLVVRNFLLVTDAMSDDAAEALVRGLIEAQPRLEAASLAARSIEIRSAIETTPIPLHPGALRYYRDVKV